MLIPKTKKIPDEKHLKWIRTLPCCVKGSPYNVVAAHIRKGSGAGTGQKPCDSFVVPLRYDLHQKQHNKGEVTFWRKHGGVEQAKKLAKDLYAISGDNEKAFKLLREFKNAL